MLVMSTQLISLAMGGILRRFLVSPPSMIWPVNLVTCALFNTLQSQQYAGIGNRGGLSRERFFFYVWLGGILSAWLPLPGTFVLLLDLLDCSEHLSQSDVRLQELSPHEHDHVRLVPDHLHRKSAPRPLVGRGQRLWWLRVLLLDHYPRSVLHEHLVLQVHAHFVSRTSFDNTGAKYDISKILTLQSTLNLTAYEAYSPLFLS